MEKIVLSVQLKYYLLIFLIYDFRKIEDHTTYINPDDVSEIDIDFVFDLENIKFLN